MDRISRMLSSGANGALLVLLYGCTIFFSAFLLFQVQPIIGKMLLPWFGGSAAVWSICLLFFQVLLLLGYLYAHWTSTLLAPRRQALLHLALLASSLAVLPITPDAALKPAGGDDPTLLIIGIMTMTVGLPYFMLSTTGPLLQAWFAREKPGTVPYRLFALSNFGSMLGLFSYPILFEPRLTIPGMSVSWSFAYVGFALLCGVLAWRGLAHRGAVGQEATSVPVTRPSVRTHVLWMTLAACPIVLLMAITSHLTQNVAPVPFLWVLPLALYLLTFILCFEGGNWYRRAWCLPIFILWVGVMNYDLIRPLADRGIWVPVALYCSGLFVSSMMCHGELARRKPHPEHLTSFYLMIASGGAVGGTFVAIIAPRLFNSNYELPLAAVATALVIVTLVEREWRAATGTARRHQIAIGAMGCTVALVAILAAAGTAYKNGTRDLLARNFYGTLGIADSYDNGRRERRLVHGAILHGSQFMETGRRNQPTTYYGDNGGAGMAVLATRRDGQPQKVGVIGLGAGTMAAYGRPGDFYRFYEINPLVVELARTRFSFLSDSAATVETALGDARLTLERERPQQFDALVVDAFSGDSIPVHLLTREAFAAYLRHMKPGGILAVHISNRNLDLAPVVKHAADHYGKTSRLVDADADALQGLSGSTWVLIGDQAAMFDHDAFKNDAAEYEPGSRVRGWTDDYSSIYAILK